MNVPITLIGYGEAGRTFAQSAGWGAGCCVYDLKSLTTHYAEDGVNGCDTSADAITGSAHVISVVTADQALIAAYDATKHILNGALYFDMNSVAPATKREAAIAIAAAGGRYVDVAVMSPVNPNRLDVPLLISGSHALIGKDVLEALGFSNVRIVGDDIGRASTIKMLRSVMYKGVEALTAECLIACERAGVTEEVLGSFGNDWSSSADYRIDRMMVHGVRRAAEMTEVVKTLEALGVAALMTCGSAERQAQIGNLGITAPPEGLNAKLKRLKNL